MALNTDQTSKTSVSFREWIRHALSLLIFSSVILLIGVFLTAIDSKRAQKVRYNEPYEDVIINSDKIGKADVEFLNRTFRSVEKGDTATRTETPIILEQILYKHATYLGDTTFKGMYTYILKQGDVAIEPNIWQDEQGIHENTDSIAASANIALPLSSEQWDQILHLFEHTFESGGMENFELGFQVHEDHLEIISHPSAVFDKTKHYIPSDPYGNPPGLQSPTHWSTGSVSKVSITKGHLWMDSEVGHIVLYDASHKLWFIRAVDSLLFMEH